MVIEQVDLIDIEETTIGRRQQPWCEVAGATRQRCCKIETAGNAIFTGIERERHQVYRSLKSREDFFTFIAHLAVATHPLRGGWIAEVGTVGNACDRWQQLR